MENNKRFLGLLIGIIAIVMVGGAAWWGYTFFYPAPEAVYAQLRSAVIAGDKEKMKSFMDASALDPEAVKQFDKITPEELRKMADLLAPDISKFITISSDVEGNKLTLIKRFDKPSETKPLSTTLFAIQFVKQSNNRTYKIGRISGNSENTDLGDKKEHESSVQKNIRRLRREFSLTIEPSKLSLREQLEEASSNTTKPRFSGDSVSVKFIEAVQMGNHAAYVKTEQESEKEGLDVVVIAFNLENGEWDVNMGEGTTTSFFPLPSEEELKMAVADMKNKYFIEAVGWDFRYALRRDDYKFAANLFSADSGQTAEKLKNLFDQFPTLDGIPFMNEVKDANATLSLGVGEEAAIADLVKENGVWKISKITPPALSATKEK